MTMSAGDGTFGRRLLARRLVGDDAVYAGVVVMAVAAFLIAVCLYFEAIG